MCVLLPYTRGAATVGFASARLVCLSGLPLLTVCSMTCCLHV